jgi:hypothetical protein
LFRPEKSSNREDYLLGPSRDTANYLLPVFMKCAEKHVKVRLYGILQPFTGTIQGHTGPIPKMMFIVWKVHTPSDPDVLPPGQAIQIDANSGPPTFTNEAGKPEPPMKVQIGPATNSAPANP